VRRLPHIALTEEPSPDDVQFLDDRLYEFNVAATGRSDGRLLALFARDAPADTGLPGRIVGGLYGWTWGGACEIRFLWVEERWRGRGLGSRLLTLAEDEARRRGARQILLSTHSFQAPDFYRRLGFEVVASLADYPSGHSQIWLRKSLSEAPPGAT